MPPHLFAPFSVGGLTLPNRIVLSPMCQYSSDDGFASDWHLVHLGSRAAGGAGLVFMEATAVSPEGRISPGDMGIWKDDHIPNLARITRFIHSQGAYAGIQLAHAGRKASTRRPWEEEGLALPDEGGWRNVAAPSAIPFAPHYAFPVELAEAGIASIVEHFGAAARRAAEAGFDVIEIHAAHGYLLHEFFSPLSNHREDGYGGSFEGRTRIGAEIVDTIRTQWRGPLFIRISATDWAEGGWDPDQSVRLAANLKKRSVDLVDVSSGGLIPGVKIPAGPGYQTGFAERIRCEADIPTGTVGFITDPAQGDHVIRTGQADLVFMARELLRDPYWPLRASARLEGKISWPRQYLRSAPAGSAAREPIPTTRNGQKVY